MKHVLHTLRWALAVALVVSVAHSDILAQQLSIQGDVLEQTGDSPIFEAQVLLLDKHTIIAETRTNFDGQFALQAPRGLEVTLVVRFPGKSALRYELRPDHEETYLLRAKLAQAGTDSELFVAKQPNEQPVLAALASVQ